MHGQQLYPVGLTDAEAVAGFAIEPLEPDEYGQRYRAVVYRERSRPIYRLVKMMATEDRMVYRLQGFGRYSFETHGEEPRWLPLESYKAADPNFLAETLQTLIAGHSSPQFVAVDPVQDA